MRKKKLLVAAVAIYAILSILVVFSVYGDGINVVKRLLGRGQDAGESVLVDGGEGVIEGEQSFVEWQRLPALERMDENEARKYVGSMQVMRKIKLLGLNAADWLYPKQNYEALYAAFDAAGEGAGEDAALFDGETASELNRFLEQNAGKAVRVDNGTIAMDEPIRVPSHTRLSGRRTLLAGDAEIGFSLDKAEDVSIDGFAVDGGIGFGVYAIDARDIAITGCDIENALHKPMVFMGQCANIVLRGNTMKGNLEGGLYLNGDIEKVLIEDNDIVDNSGTSNWMAGVVLTAIDVKDAANVYAKFRADLHFPDEQRLDSMLSAPHDIILKGNRVIGNNSSGVYCDGPYRVYILDNTIEGNDKEGMCLDYGTIAAYVAENAIVANGNRGRQTDEDLKNDFVLDAGRLDDGSSCSKLPGISIDNSAYNIVYDNRVERNYGSGIKMVRTGVRNILSTNLITDNNRGQSDRFHFFGVELGYAQADVPATNLDFSPDYENIVCRNLISGAHYAGIFMDKDVYINDFFDNTIVDATWWSMECLSDKFNSCLNNFSTVQSRGIALSSVLAVPVAGMVN